MPMSLVISAFFCPEWVSKRINLLLYWILANSSKLSRVTCITPKDGVIQTSLARINKKIQPNEIFTHTRGYSNISVRFCCMLSPCFWTMWRQSLSYLHEEDLHKETLKRMWQVFTDNIVPLSFVIPRTVFKLNYSASDSADKNGVKNRLKKFISRRPSMKTLQEKGIIKG